MHYAHGYLGASFFSPFSLVQQDWRWWLENFRGHAPSIGWPEVGNASASSGVRDFASNPERNADVATAS